MTRPLTDIHSSENESIIAQEGENIPDRRWLTNHLDTRRLSLPPPTTLNLNTNQHPMIIDKVVTSSLLEHHAVIIHHLLHLCRHPDQTLDLIYLIRAENRYVKWLFLLERLRASGDEGLVTNGTIVPPIDVLLMWLVHLTAIRHYVEDISRLFDDALLYISPPLHRIRQLLELANDRLVPSSSSNSHTYFDAQSARMWTLFTGEDWVLLFNDESPFYVSCPTCTFTNKVTKLDYLKLKLEPGFDKIVCPPCGTVLTSSFLSAVRFVNDFKGALRESNVYVAGTLLNCVTGKPNHYLSKQIIQYLSQAPSVANLYASVIVPVPTPPPTQSHANATDIQPSSGPSTSGIHHGHLTTQDNCPTPSTSAPNATDSSAAIHEPLDPASNHTTAALNSNSGRASFLFRSQTNGYRTPAQLLDPWCEIANILFQLEVDLYALEIEDHRLISWHIRAAIDRMERGYRNLVTPLSIDLVLRVRSVWRTTATLLVAWLTFAGAKDMSDDSEVPSQEDQVDSDVDDQQDSDTVYPLPSNDVPAARDFAQINHHPADAVMAMLPQGMLGIRGAVPSSQVPLPPSPVLPPPPPPSRSPTTPSFPQPPSPTSSRPTNPTTSILGKKPKLFRSSHLTTNQPNYNLSVMVIPVSPTSSSFSPAITQNPNLSSARDRHSLFNPFYESRASMASALPSPIALEVNAVSKTTLTTMSDVPSTKYKLSRGKLHVPTTTTANHRRKGSSSSLPPQPTESRHGVSSSYAHPPPIITTGGVQDPLTDPIETQPPIPKLLAIVDPIILHQMTVRYHQFTLLQQSHSGLYSARLALPLDLVLANWTHLLFPPQYIRFSNSQFGRLITFEFSSVQSLDAALQNTARKWRRRYKHHLDLGYRPKLSWTDKFAAIFDRVMGRLVSATPI